MMTMLIYPFIRNLTIKPILTLTSIRRLALKVVSKLKRTFGTNVINQIFFIRRRSQQCGRTGFPGLQKNDPQQLVQG